MKKNIKQIIFYVVLVAVLIVVCTLMFMPTSKSEKTTYDDILRYFNNEQVEKFSLDTNNDLTLTLKSGEVIEYRIQDKGLFYNDLGETIRDQVNANILTEVEYIPQKQYSAWLSYLPMIIIAVVLIIIYIIMIRQVSGGGMGKANSFSKSRAKMASVDDKNRVTFADVAGADEEKEELEEIVEFLKNPAAFAKLGAKIPHGVLLMGPPGTGKTLLAKAVAGEAGVPFFSISGSDFVEMYVGVGASRVRDLFENARKANSAIIFIDEIDAVGRHRGAGLGGGHDER